MAEAFWYLRRAVPWTALLGGPALGSALVLLVHRWESLAGLVLPLVAVVAAAAAAFALDEPSAAVTTVTPRGRRWAHTARAVAALVPLGAGAALLLAAPATLRGDLSDWLLTLAGLGALVLCLGLSAAVRQHPGAGGAIAAAVVLAGLTPLVLGVLLDLDPPYPLPQLSDGLRAMWGVAFLGGVAGSARLLVAAGPR
ncbi:MAG TPA: hypothetical protein VD859_12425 [Nocardioides sp.]|nr:hypothetical protein [Nocardioides sp.]